MPVDVSSMAPASVLMVTSDFSDAFVRVGLRTGSVIFAAFLRVSMAAKAFNALAMRRFLPRLP